MIDDAVNEESDIRHEFAYPRGIRFLIDGPLQDVGFSDAFEKVIKVLAVGDETGFFQVASTAITRGMIVLVLTRVLVSQNELRLILNALVCSWNMIFKDGSRTVVSSVVNL